MDGFVFQRLHSCLDVIQINILDGAIAGPEFEFANRSIGAEFEHTVSIFSLKFLMEFHAFWLYCRCGSYG